MTRRTRKTRTDWAEPDAPPPLICDHPDCTSEASYRAPRTREGDGNYWFCLDHVREYNKAWNYFEGMSEEEIFAYQREDVTGHRPTWPMGTNGRTHDHPDSDPESGVFGMFRDALRGNGGDETSRPAAAAAPRDPELNRALDIMNLTLPIARDDLKLRYKELVKRHHPDANGGDKKAEERLKLINQAYSHLMATDSL